MKIPSMSENNITHLKFLINSLDAYDLNNPFDPLYNIVGNLLNKVPVAQIQLRVPYDIFQPLNPEHMFGCFRVRKFESLDNLKSQIQTEHDLWARPKELVKDFGRCHSPNQEVLYCSNNMLVAMAETDVKPGDFCVITRYASTTSLSTLNTILLGDSRRKFEDSSEWNPLSYQLEEHLCDEDRLKLHTIEAYITRIFQNKILANEAIKYKLSAAISKFYFGEPSTTHSENEPTKIECILYPSIKANLKSYNLAILNESARSHLAITNALIVKVHSIRDTTYDFEFVAQLTELDPLKKFVWNSISGKNATKPELQSV